MAAFWGVVPVFSTPSIAIAREPVNYPSTMDKITPRLTGYFTGSIKPFRHVGVGQSSFFEPNLASYSR
jgi:hypothetical protein